MAETTTRRSPLGHRAADLAAAPAAVRLRELPFLTQLNLRLDPAGPAAEAVGEALGAPLPTRSNTAVRAGDVTVLWLGPDEWLVVAPPGAPEELEKSLRLALGTEAGAVVDLSAHRTTVEPRGTGPARCSPRAAPWTCTRVSSAKGSCAQTLLAQAPVLLLSRGDDASYWLLVRASFATYLVDWLLDASSEYAEGDP